jgi:hypothetical protein
VLASFMSPSVCSSTYISWHVSIRSYCSAHIQRGIDRQTEQSRGGIVASARIVVNDDVVCARFSRLYEQRFDMVLGVIYLDSKVQCQTTFI